MLDPWCVAATEASWRRGFVRLPRIACLFFFCPVVAWTPLVKFQVSFNVIANLSKILKERICHCLHMVIFISLGLGDWYE